MKLKEFLTNLEGEAGRDFFATLAQIVRFAGPGRLLPAFFPQLSLSWQQTSYAASEPGWKGSYKNITTKIMKYQGGWQVNGSKNYILEAEYLILLAKYEAQPALVLLPFSVLNHPEPLSGAGMCWPGHYRQIQHYRASIDAKVSEEFICLPRVRDFLLLSAQIPVTEFIGFVWLLLLGECPTDEFNKRVLLQALDQSEKAAIAAAQHIYAKKRHSHNLPQAILPHLQPLWQLYDRLTALSAGHKNQLFRNS